MSTKIDGLAIRALLLGAWTALAGCPSDATIGSAGGGDVTGLQGDATGIGGADAAAPDAAGTLDGTGPACGKDGDPCDDGDPCTLEDLCQGGACQAGAPMACDDGLECTTDACVDGGCVYTPNVAPCDDGDPCTAGDTCADGVCAGDPGGGCASDADCAGLVDACYSVWRCTTCACEPDPDSATTPPPLPFKPCHQAACDPVVGWQLVPGPDGQSCDDMDACTSGDTCAAGACTGAPVSCDDGLLCTEDACDPATGCETTANPACEGCPAQRLVAIQFATDTTTALDVTGDGLPDNALAPLAAMVNGPLAEDVAAGTFTWLAQHAGLTDDGSPYTLSILHGDPVDGCDPTIASCAYVVRTLSFTDACVPKFTFANATLEGTHLTAGGQGTTVVARFTMIPNVIVEYTLRDIRVDAELAVGVDGLGVVTGTIGGVVTMDDLVASIEAVPDGQLPIAKDTLLALLAASVIPDVNLDGDGGPEGISFALNIAGEPAAIAAVAEDACPVCWVAP